MFKHSDHTLLQDSAAHCDLMIFVGIWHTQNYLENLSVCSALLLKPKYPIFPLSIEEKVQVKFQLINTIQHFSNVLILLVGELCFTVSREQKSVILIISDVMRIIVLTSVLFKICNRPDAVDIFFDIKSVWKQEKSGTENLIITLSR